jgi:polysaccharide deacetylase 2 family uncharacterized protein YibQ
MMAAVLCLFTGGALCDISPSLSTIVLIVDDMGNNMALGEQALQLPGPVNYAFLPHRHTSTVLAEKAHRLNKEVLLHAPMSNVHNKPLGDGALTMQMDKKEFTKILEADIDSVPYAQGVNNHMGSLLTQMPRQMGWLMTVLKQRQLYFIDSRTSAETTAESMAIFHQLPNLRRHVFLDNDRDIKAIDAQFERLLTIASHQKVTVAIGHPYPETIELLQRKLPSLQLRGYRLALASDVIMEVDCEASHFVIAMLPAPCKKPHTVARLANPPTPSSTIN